MGYGIIFWINETPIRNALQKDFKHLIEGANSGKSSNPATDFCKGTDRNKLFAPIGNSVIQLSKLEYSGKFSLPFDGQENVFNYTIALHSTAETPLMWTGNKLIHLGGDHFDYNSFKTIAGLEKLTDYDCFSFPLKHDMRNAIVNKTSQWNNVSATKGEYSIYWISDDYTEGHDKKNDAIVGEQLLNLILSNWNHSKSILNYGNPLNKVCSVLKPQFAFFIWAQNCLSILAEIDTEKVLGQLKKDRE